MSFILSITTKHHYRRSFSLLAKQNQHQHHRSVSPIIHHQPQSAIKTQLAPAIAASPNIITDPHLLTLSLSCRCSSSTTTTTTTTTTSTTGDNSSNNNNDPSSSSLSSLFANDPLFPSPTNENIHRYGMPLLARAAHHAKNGRILAYCDNYSHCEAEGGREEKRKEMIAVSYREILRASTRLRDFFAERKKKDNATADDNDKATNDDATPQRIAYLCPPGPLYVAVQFAVWSSGSIAVPLCTSHKSTELAYVLQDCDPAFVIDGTMSSSISGGSGGGGGGMMEGRELRHGAREANVMDRYWCLDDILADFTTTLSRDDDSSLSKRKKETQSQQTATQNKSTDTPGATGDTNTNDNNNAHEYYALGTNGIIPTKDHPALIIYTSGTTGNPKGVVHTHENLYHQTTDLVTSWGWTEEDSILHFLPLHHVHGVINKLACPIWAGASVEFVKFNPFRIWERLAQASENFKKASSSSRNKEGDAAGDNASGDGSNDSKGDANAGAQSAVREPTVFMAVPTIYAKMLEVVPKLPTTLKPSEVMRHSPIRLMVSGSAALPTGVFNRWKTLTGHTILERYGMSEFSMALSNPLTPVEKRLPGYVGLPLPSVQVKIIDEDTGDVIPKQQSSSATTDDDDDDDDSTTLRSGELCVKGPTVFSEYWRKPHATAESFDFDGYFKTGDVAEYDSDHDSYHILGRVSADIIKCAGHKLSSLQIERTLLEHPAIVEAVVLGVPDETYGERVGLLCRLRVPANDDDDRTQLQKFGLKTLQKWCEGQMAKYKIPSRIIVMREDIPKNVMGKVSKKQLVHMFEDEEKVQK